MKLLLIIAANLLTHTLFAPQTHLYCTRSGDNHITMSWAIQPRWTYSIQSASGINQLEKLNATVYRLDSCAYGSASFTVQTTGQMKFYRLFASTNSSLICR